MAVSTIDNNGVNLGQLGNRNMIINGGMQVDQRNGGAAVTVGGSVVYVTDRFSSQNTTLTGTITGQQSTLGNSKSFKLTATSAVTNLTTSKFVLGLLNVLEAQDVYHLNSTTVTLSFTVETNWTGNLSVGFRNFDGTRSYIANLAVTSGTNNVSVTVPFEAGTVDAIDSGKGLIVTIGANNEDTYQTATTDAWVSGNLITSTSSTQWAKTTGNFINITNLQLEAGDTATPFEHRSYGDELARCQRYYERIIGTNTSNVFGVLQVFTVNEAQGGYSFATTKRSVPTMSSGGVFRVRSAAGSSQSAALTFPSINKEQTDIVCTTTTGALLAGDATMFRCDQNAWFAADAEL